MAYSPADGKRWLAHALRDDELYLAQTLLNIPVPNPISLRFRTPNVSFLRS